MKVFTSLCDTLLPIISLGVIYNFILYVNKYITENMYGMYFMGYCFYMPLCTYIQKDTYRKYAGNVSHYFFLHLWFNYMSYIICHIYIYAMLFENLIFFAIVEPLQKEKYEFT